MSCTACAGPPFLTDDPEPVDLHHVEINVIGQQQRTASGRAGIVSAEANFGCAAETQCHVAVPVAFDHEATGTAQVGLGDVEAGLKYRLFDQGDEGWSAAVYPTVQLPTGDAARGLGNGRAQVLLPLWVQRAFARWTWDAGMARLVDPAPGARDSWFAGLLAQRRVGDAVTLGAEIYHRTSTATDTPAATGFNIGAIVKLASDQNLLVSAGRGLTHAETNRCSMFLAWQLER